ncbi:hypothetical protein ACVWZR_009733 [Bradyrhizobium sp. i1.3.1]
MQIAVDPADLVLARRPVARHRVDMAVDQAGRDRGAVGLDDGGRAFGVEVLEAADRSDLAVLGDDGVAVQDRLFQGAGQDQADIPDHELRGSGGLGGVMRHGRGSLFLTATLAILGSLDPGSKQDYSLVHE